MSKLIFKKNEVIKAYYKKYILNFLIPSETSRGMLWKRVSWFICIKKQRSFGIGECAPLLGLSRDNITNYEEKIQWVCDNIDKGMDELCQQLRAYPSIVFGLEQAFLSFKRNDLVLFPSDFTLGVKGISINGLIWMGSIEFMQAQLDHKVQQGFKCIKIKIGSHSFNKEYDFLARAREKYPDIELRLDANGAFSSQEVLQRLEKLSSLKIHSIEQPISPGQIELMAKLCQQTPIPIVLDEELIGDFSYKEKKELLNKIAPQYFVLKLSLCGGFTMAKEWIDIAKEKNIRLWITSTLESNIGLSAIAQWTYLLGSSLSQGLGTGSLYSNNIPSPLSLDGQFLYYKFKSLWDLTTLIK